MFLLRGGRRQCLRSVVLLLAWATIAVFRPAVSAAELDTGFIDRVYKDADGDHKYVLFVPRNYDPEKKWPVILYLHGAGERGDDGRRQTEVGLGPYVKQRADTFPFLVVFPQNENVRGRILTAWSSTSADGQRAIAILDEVAEEFNVDRRRQILTGWSMGGYGAWSLGAAAPDRWAAVVPISGGGDPRQAERLKETPVWVFHGAQDDVVRPDESQRMVNALKAAGGSPRSSELEDVGHDAWRVAYASEALFEWMLQPTADGAASVALRVLPGRRAPLAADSGAKFLPAVEIPQAVSVRLGNDMLRAASYSIPQLAPASLLRGSIGDIYTSTSASGRTFSVQFTGIRYRGDLTRAHIYGDRPDRLVVQLGLENVGLNIGTTYVSGSGRSAVAGPIGVSMGYRGPVWLSIVVKPYIEKRRVRLQLISSRFDIPSHNFSVSGPAGVSTRGLGMTRERVSSGLISGLYGSRGRIEQEVVQIVPELLAKLEEQIDFTKVSQVVERFWPLPVYQPRVKVWPEEIQTDADGISLVFGVVAAAIDTRTAPPTPRRRSIGSLPADRLAKATSLQVGFVPELLRPLTELLIESDVARIHVQDLPGQSFASFADKKSLSAILPDLQRFPDDVEIWSELILAAPITTHPAAETARPNQAPLAENGGEPEDATAGDAPTNDAPPRPDVDEDEGAVVQFCAPKVLISLALRTKDDGEEWMPYAEFDIDFTHAIRTQVVKPDFETRVMCIDWVGTPTARAQGRFAPGYKPEDMAIATDVLETQFAESWQRFIGDATIVKRPVPDIDFNYTSLRLTAAQWQQPQLVLEFDNPGVKLTNLTALPLEYETKGPHSDWGSPLTLVPGDSHFYDIPYPLIYRSRIDGSYRMFTLPVGSHSEYRVPRTGGAAQLFKAEH